MTKGLLLADENFPLSVIKRLVASGYDVSSVALDCPGISDRAVLELACRTNRRLLTFDADFGDLVFFQGCPPPDAILYVRIHPVIPEEVLKAVLRALPETPSAHFAVVTSKGTRLRPFPQPEG